MNNNITKFSTVGHVTRNKKGGLNVFIDNGRYYLYISKYALILAKGDDEELHVVGKAITTKSGNLMLLCNNGHKFLVNRKDNTVSYIQEPTRTYTTEYENNSYELDVID